MPVNATRLLTQRITRESIAKSGDLRPVQEVIQARIGKRVNPATLWRWVVKGAHGCKLVAVMTCGQWHTTPEAYAQFLMDQTAVHEDEACESSSTGRTKDRTEQLKKAGLLK